MTSFFITASMLVSQNLFAKTYGTTGYEQGHSIIQTSDGGYAITGYSSVQEGINRQFVVMKLSSTGEIVWQRFIDTRPPDALSGGGDYGTSSIIQTQDGGYAIIGNTIGYANGGIWDDIIVLKLTAGGDITWAKTYGEDGLEYGQRLLQTPDQGYTICGGCWGDIYPTRGWAYFLAKLDNSGNTQWAWFYDVPQHDNGRGFCRTTNGYALSGYNREYGIGWDAYVIITDASGALQWAKAYGGNSSEGCDHIIPSYNGVDFIVAGATLSYGAGNNDILVTKINPSGGVVWARAIGGAGDDFTQSIVSVGNGEYIIAATTTSFGSDDDIVILRIDDNGNLTQVKALIRTGRDAIGCLTPTSDGGFVLIGTTNVSGFATDIIVIKVNSSGDYPGCLVDRSLTNTPITPNVTNASPTTGARIPPSSPFNPAVSVPAISPSNACTPLEARELYEYVPSPAITCSPVPGGLLFNLSSAMEIRVYSPDGRLAYSGELKEGQTRIFLDQGVYLWQAGPYKGKAVVR